MKKQRNDVGTLFWQSQFSTCITLNTANGRAVDALSSHTPAHTFMYNLISPCCHLHAPAPISLANSDKKHQRA
jgi:hypothetical protein